MERLISTEPILVKTDRNGSKHFRVNACDKCSGYGVIDCFRFNEAGRCFKCSGSGYHPWSYIERTPEYEAKLEARREAKRAKERTEKRDLLNTNFLEKEGFNREGYTWLVLGNTYNMCERLKADGAKFNYQFLWRFSSEKEGYNLKKVHVSEICGTDMYGIYDLSFAKREAIEEIRNSFEKAQSKSEYFAEEGDKIEIEVVYDGRHSFSSPFGYLQTSYIYKFLKGSDIVIWKSSVDLKDRMESLEKGQVLKIKGTVKALGEYRNEKQTEITRMKVVG